MLPTLALGADVSELEKKVNVLTQEVAKLRMGGGQFGNAAAEKVYGLASGLSFGGYGELTYTTKRTENESDAKVAGSKTADALRNILYVGYKFDEKWLLNTEIEVEHANEIFLEFAYLDYMHSDALNARVGLVLAPVGFINETHEPATFFSVNRPSIAKKIIPTTWREHGAGVYGTHAGFNYKLFVMNSLDGASTDSNDNLNFGNDGVRAGRQKGSKANAQHLSYVARLDYNGVKGLNIGGTIYTGKLNGTADAGHDLFEVHGEYKIGAFKTRALYTWSELDGKKISTTAANKMTGYYVEAGYDVMAGKGMGLTPFVRYETLNTQDEVQAGNTADKSKDETNVTFGVQIKPIDRIAFKIDYVKNTNEAKTGQDSWNLGMGWHF